MKPFLTFGLVGALAVSTLGITSCTKDDSSATNANVELRFTDAPANYEAIWLNVASVEISDANGAWTNVPLVRPGLYDILRFRNGVDTLLGRVDLPAGRISDVRLKLNDGNKIVVNGTMYDLKVPSGTSSGYKIKLNDDLIAGKSYVYWLDFDAAQSVVETGNNTYILKPVVRAYAAPTSGTIKGYVLPGAALATVYAIQGTDTFAAIPDASTYFQISGLPSGSYNVWYDGTNGYRDTTITGVPVTFGNITDLGTRVLNP